MALSYTPKTEEQLAEENRVRLENLLWPAGPYSFEITTAKDAVSSSGNDMISLTMNIYNESGEFKQVFDYLLTIPSMEHKFRHAAYACGLGEKYESGVPLEAFDFEQKNGSAYVKIQEASSKNGKDYPAKNAIDDYILSNTQEVARTQAKTAKAQASSPELSDDIPF